MHPMLLHILVRITRETRRTSENCNLGGITWTPQSENDAERRESVHAETHFSANDMQ
jgi:hypothetical protein